MSPDGTSPVVDAHNVILGAHGRLEAYDRRTGAARWTADIGPGGETGWQVEVFDPFLLGSGDVFVSSGMKTALGSQPGTTSRVDPSSGSVVAATSASSYVQAMRGTRWAATNRLTTSDAGDPLAYVPLLLEVGDLDDPTFHWGGRPSTSSDGGTFHKALTLGEDRLYQRSNPAQNVTWDQIIAYDLTTPCVPDPVTDVPKCVPLWTTSVYNSGEEITISEDGETLFLATYGGGNVAAHRCRHRRGALALGQHRAASRTSPVAGGLVYACRGAASSRSSTPTVVGATTCSPLWTVAAPGTVWTNVVVAGDVAYAGAHGGFNAGGHVIAFPAAGCGAASCEPIWTGSMGSTANDVPTELVVALGHVYTVSWNSLTAWALPT